jgi:hypothetical protein
VHVVAKEFTQYENNKQECRFTTVTQCPLLAILATCRQFSVEDETVMKRNFDSILNTPLRLIVDIESLWLFENTYSPVRTLPHPLYRMAELEPGRIPDVL